MRGLRGAACGVALVGLAVLISGCTGGSPAPAPSPTTSGSPSGTTTGTTATSEPFDCTAVSAAQQALNDASTQELSRLGIDRSDPRAFTVTLVVASQEAAEYWRAVESAATDTLDDERRDLELVTGYWGAIDAELDAIEIADSSDAAVQRAADELSEVSRRHPQADLAPAQQRLQDVLAATCGIEPAPAPPTSP